MGNPKRCQTCTGYMLYAICWVVQRVTCADRPSSADDSERRRAWDRVMAVAVANDSELASELTVDLDSEDGESAIGSDRE